MNNANVIKRGDTWWIVLDNSTGSRNAVNSTARKLFSQDVAELCILHDDNSESVIQTRATLERILSNEYSVGIFLGTVNENR